MGEMNVVSRSFTLQIVLGCPGLVEVRSVDLTKFSFFADVQFLLTFIRGILEQIFL
jgi:hypothetical protein